MFLCDNQWKISTFSILKLWNQFSGRRKPFSKNWNTIFLLKLIRLKTHHFHTKVSCQKPMLRQIESGVQNGPITKNGTLAVTALFFWKIYFILRTFFKVLILCPNYRNVQIHTFHKRWSFKWGCVFPVSILKVSLLLFYIILSIFMVLSFNMIFTELQNHVLHCKFLIFIMRKKKLKTGKNLLVLSKSFLVTVARTCDSLRLSVSQKVFSIHREISFLNKNFFCIETVFITNTAYTFL